MIDRGPAGVPRARRRDWGSGTWLNPPASAHVDGGHLVVVTGEGGDFWRTTSYGFVHDSGHALLSDIAVGEAVEVTFEAEFSHQFDQAGVMVRVDERTWIKAGLELTDDVLHAGAVATRDMSDWSLQPVQDWGGTVVTVRVSRAVDSVTVRARSASGPWQVLRLAPLATTDPVGAGPFACSPGRGGMRVRFLSWTSGAADVSLHAT